MKTWINRALNMGLFWCVCGFGGSGLVMKFRLGGEYPYLPSDTILGLSWADWALLHLSLGISILSLVVLHLLMNRQWIYRIAAARNSRALALGLVVGASIVVTPLVVPLG